MREGRPPQSFKKRELRPSERKIIEALEEKKGTFTEVLKRVDISKATFSKSLQDLEEKNKVTRYYDSGKVIIRLTEETMDAVERTLRRLDRITERPTLDLEGGRRLIIEEVVEWIKETGTYEWNPREGRITSGREKGEKREEDFNEHLLLKSLTRYLIERNIFVWGRSEETLKNYFDKILTTHPVYRLVNKEFQEIAKSEGFDIEHLPVFKAAKEKGIIGNIGNLLVWIRPLVEPEPFKEETPTKSSEIESYGFTFKASNLAAAVCRSELLHWYKTLDRSWRAKKSRLKEKEGGE